MELERRSPLIGEWAICVCWRGGRLGVSPNSAVSLAPSVGGTIMVDILELPRARINASMLTQFIDRPVCFVGRLEKVRGLGKRAGHRGHPEWLRGGKRRGDSR